MASYAYTFTSGDTVTPTKFNDARTVSNIVNADVSNSAAIAGTKIAPNFGSQSIATTGSLVLNGALATTVKHINGGNVSAGTSFRSSGQGVITLANEGGATAVAATSLAFVRGRGALGAPDVVQSGDWLGGITFQGNDGTAPVIAARITAEVDGTPGTDDMPGRLIFSTTADGASSPTERMRITSAGNVGIGMTSPQAPLDIFGSGNTLRFTGTGPNTTGGISFFNSTEQRAEIGASGSSGAITIHSDPNNAVASSNIRLLVDGAEAMRIDAAGNVGIGTTAPNAAALLTITSTTKGFLPPRMTTAQRDAISTPPAGLMIYNTTTNKLNVRTASSWEAVTSA